MGAGVGLAVNIFCQVSLLSVFLQPRVPEIESTLVHLAPNLDWHLARWMGWLAAGQSPPELKSPQASRGYCRSRGNKK